METGPFTATRIRKPRMALKRIITNTETVSLAAADGFLIDLYARPASVASTLSLIGLFWFQAAVGDEIVMTNGDRLSGRILHTDSDSVLLKTEYAGTLAIERSQVRTLRRDSAQSHTDTLEPADIKPGKVEEGSELNEQRTTATRPDGKSSLPARVESAKRSAFVPGSELSGRVNFALSSEKGNSDKNEVDFDYQVGYRQGWHRIESIGSLEFDTAGDEQTADKWSTYNRYSRHFPSRWYGSAWLALKHDRFADLRLRTLAGPALGYIAFEGDARNLSIDAGPMILHDDYYDQSDQKFLGPAWFLNYDQLVWQEHLQFYHRQFGYLDWHGEEKFLWQSWTGLRVPLGDGFTGSVEFEYDYDSNPAVETRNTDTTLRLKLGYHW
jgi:putative salt-induced outer membrane protein YdiY